MSVYSTRYLDERYGIALRSHVLLEVFFWFELAKRESCMMQNGDVAGKAAAATVRDPRVAHGQPYMVQAWCTSAAVTSPGIGRGGRCGRSTAQAVTTLSIGDMAAH